VVILLSLLKQNCSSPQSALRTLENKMLPRLIREEDKQVCLDLIELGKEINVPSKAIELLKLIKQSDEQAIVYSEYRTTIDLLADLLKEHNITVTTYHGALSSEQKQLSIEKFKNKDAQV